MTGMLCADCGSSRGRRFTAENCVVAHDGRTADVADLSGWRCEACGEVLFDPDSAERYAAAGDALVLAARKA